MYEICDIQTNKIFVIHEYFFNQILCYDFFNDAVKWILKKIRCNLSYFSIKQKTKNKQISLKMNMSISVYYL